MKQYVCDLEYARQLKELGVPQNGSYCWRKTGCRYALYSRDLRIRGSYDAFNSDELLERLPKKIHFNNYLLNIEVKSELRPEAPKSGNLEKFWEIFYYITYRCCYHGDVFFKKEIIKDKKLSNALAKMYIYLKKEGYTK